MLPRATFELRVYHASWIKPRGAVYYNPVNVLVVGRSDIIRQGLSTTLIHNTVKHVLNRDFGSSIHPLVQFNMTVGKGKHPDAIVLARRIIQKRIAFTIKRPPARSKIGAADIIRVHINPDK